MSKPFGAYYAPVSPCDPLGATRTLVTRKLFGLVDSVGIRQALFRPFQRSSRSFAQSSFIRRAAFLLVLLALPAAANANVWRDSFGKQWFYANVANSGKLAAGAWWESDLKPGNTYTISFRVTKLNGAIGLYVGGRSMIRIDNTGSYTFDFAIQSNAPRRMVFTAQQNNTTVAVSEIRVVERSSSSDGGDGGGGGGGGGDSGSDGNSMPKGHYLNFSRERNLEKEMLNYIDDPSISPSNWHMGIAEDMHDALTMRAVKGFSVHVPWRSLETSDNRFNWILLDANMRVARRLNKKFIVKITTRSFNDSNPVPSYFPSSQSVWNGGGFTAKLWDKWTYNRLIRLHEKIIDRYGSDSAFGGIATSETSVGNVSSGNYSLSSYRNALTEMANRTQSALREAGNGRFFWYLNFVRGGDSANLRQDVRVNLLKNDVEHDALAIGGPDITPDAGGMPGSVNGYRIHTRKTMSDVDQFCHLQHADQGQGGTNRKSNRSRRDYQEKVDRWRAREEQPWFDGPRAIFEFSELLLSRGSPVQLHPDSVLGQLWHPSEIFDFADRNFQCDYFFWNYRENVHNRQDEFWWEDIQPIIRNNEYFYRR